MNWLRFIGVLGQKKHYSEAMKKIRAGIIGLGVGEQHIDGYLRHPECEVTTLCDFSDEKLRMAHKKYPELKITDNPDHILTDPNIDVVSVASYDNFHFDQVMKCLAADKHVFVEKPLCLDSNQARQIVSLFRTKHNLRLSSNLILRLSPRFTSIKGMIDSGRMGQIYYFEGDYHYGRLHKITHGWRGDIDFYSVVYGGAVHIIDLITWLSGDTVEEVVAFGNKIASRGTLFKYNDFVCSLLKFKSGMIAKVTANFGCVKPHFHALEIFGTKATYINQRDFGVMYTSSEHDSPPQICNSEYPGVHKGDLIYSFVQSLLGEAEAMVSAEDVFRTMAVCFAIEESSNLSKPVKVDYFWH